jgi:NAD-dependent dihydropyrimidine dehydrogenase PreA subunit
MTRPGAAMRVPSEASRDRQRFVAVVEEDCTGCNACVDYCLVDCIEPAPPNPDPRSPIPISVREDECIGCFVCAKVCEELAVNAIRLAPVAEVFPGPDRRSGHHRARPPAPKTVL